MRIRTRIQLSIILSVALAVTVGLLLFLSIHAMNAASRKAGIAAEVVKGVVELKILSSEYLLHPGDRSLIQWRSRYDSVAKRLTKSYFRSPDEKIPVDKILKNLSRIKTVFTKITIDMRKKQQSGKQESAISRALQDRLEAELLVKAQAAVSLAFPLQQKVQAELVTAQKRAIFLTVVLLLTLTAVAVGISLWINRSIARPIAKLEEDTQIIGSGNLDHKVGITAKDEIGQLSRAFDKMTADLKKSTTSIVELNKEILVRKQTEEALHDSTHDLGERLKELNCLYEISSIVQKTGLSVEDILQRIVELIPPSWQYPEITCARIFFKSQEFRTKNFVETEWRQVSNVFSVDEQIGIIEVFYMEARPEKEEGPFVKEERNLIDAIAERLGKIIDQKYAEHELEKHRKHLEQMVEERTAELDSRVSEVEQLNKAMLNLSEDLLAGNEILELRTRQLADINQELDAFAYSVSHDLRAPLRAIDGFSKMLKEDHRDKLDTEGRRRLSVIQDSARDMGLLIDDLLRFSRLGRKGMRMTDINLEELVKRKFKQLQIGASRALPRLNVNTLPAAFGDHAMIREVLANLLSNAVKYTKPIENAVIEVGGRAQENENVYYVKDNGVGFDMKYGDKLFDVFQRLHSAKEFEGTGVGLSLVQRIINRHGGRVWAEGQENQGAVFYFTLPRNKENKDV